MESVTPTAPEILVDRLRTQAGWCRDLGSPLYAGLLDHAAADVAASGPLAALLRGHEADPAGSALALRLMGAVHRLVLQGHAPGLAAFYPSAGGTAPAAGETAWPAFHATVEEHFHPLRELIKRPVQTNEVGRSAALLGGFLRVAQVTALPLRLLELGASAGLNLRWDRYFYRAGAASWGDPASPVQLGDPFESAAPPLHVAVQVIERRGCDAFPVDPTSDEGRLTLMSYVWADQARRFERLHAALEVARRVPVQIESANAPDWLAKQIAALMPGAATVVFHSIVLPYLTAEAQARLRATLNAAGTRATSAAPLAWLRLEPNLEQDGDTFAVRLTLWPGGQAQLLATAGAHGQPVRWRG